MSANIKEQMGNEYNHLLNHINKIRQKDANEHYRRLQSFILPIYIEEDDGSFTEHILRYNKNKLNYIEGSFIVNDEC